MSKSEDVGEIYKEYRKIMKNRRDRTHELMNVYDNTVYRPALIKLMERCEKNGHVRGEYHNNGIGCHWFYCHQCGAKMEVESYKL